MQMGGTGYTRGGGGRAKVVYCHNLQYETSFIGVIHNTGKGPVRTDSKQIMTLCSFITTTSFPISPLSGICVAYITNEITDRQDKYLFSLIST